MTTLTEIESYYDSCLQRFRSLEDLFEEPEALRATIDNLERNKPQFRFNYFGMSYCRTDKNIVAINRWLSKDGLKAVSYHETIHMLLHKYAEQRGRISMFLSRDALTGIISKIAEQEKAKAEESVKILAAAEKALGESITNGLTDIALQNDKAALFENRWHAHRVKYPAPIIIQYVAPMFIGIGSIFAELASNLPNYSAPLVFASAWTGGHIANNYAYKPSVKEKLLAMPAPKIGKKL